jgi:hypothetical protein
MNNQSITYNLQAIINKAESLKKSGIAHNAAYIEAVKCLYPADYSNMVNICKGKKLNPEMEIPALIEQLKKEQGIKPGKSPGQKREGLAALLYMAAQGIGLIGAYPTKAMIDKQEPGNYTTDGAEITALMAGQGDRQGRAKGTPIKRFYFIPQAAGLFCLDIDAKEGKENGLKELLKVFDPVTLPDELTDIEGNFPCYVKTPNNGYHLYFKYSGEQVKNTALFPGIETKHGKPGLTAPGSENAEGKPYILYGATENAPPLFGLILDKIKRQGLIKQETKEPQKTAARVPAQWTQKQRIDMETLAAETTGGNHDKQVQFAGKCFRCKFSFADCLYFVKSRPDIFGTGRDTETTIKSVYKDNGGI